MLLIDLNQVLLSGIMPQLSPKNSKINEDLMRHMVLNIIRNHVKTFKSEYGEIVICCDSKKYWRKDVFPFYKASRKKTRDKSSLDWHLIFDTLGKFKQELKENFPYKVIDVEGAEADDVIGTLAPRFAQSQKVLILSSDGDFLQLQKYDNIKQYNPSQKKYLKSQNPNRELREKILKGDRGDGIPNVLSPSDTFVREIRQKPITKDKIDKLLSEDYNDWKDDTIKQGYARNQLLIDLSFIPTDIKEKIIMEYDNFKPVPKNKLINYFMKYKLNNLLDVMDEF